ncbi:hypothetical protein IJJ53_01770 [Candidatus Saccharibacteria bacterium]|nr:hypothetical protein [Candidatus Saccharibacteria bacterium]
MEGTRVDKVACFDMVNYERMAIGAGGILSVIKRTDGEIIYLDEYELRLEDKRKMSLIDIIDMHLEKKISDDEFEHLVRSHELNASLMRGRSYGK